MKKYGWLILLISCFCAAAAAQERQLPPPNEEGFIYFTAQQATLEPEQKKVNLTGDVTLIQKTPEGQKRTVTGQNITYDQLNTTISSVGPIRIEDGQGTVVNGENITVRKRHLFRPLQQ